MATKNCLLTTPSLLSKATREVSSDRGAATRLPVRHPPRRPEKVKDPTLKNRGLGTRNSPYDCGPGHPPTRPTDWISASVGQALNRYGAGAIVQNVRRL